MIFFFFPNFSWLNNPALLFFWDEIVELLFFLFILDPFLSFLYFSFLLFPL